MTARLVSAIDTRTFGGYLVRLGDLNHDGAHELLFGIFTNADLLPRETLYNAPCYHGR